MWQGVGLGLSPGPRLYYITYDHAIVCTGVVLQRNGSPGRMVYHMTIPSVKWHMVRFIFQMGLSHGLLCYI
jgi:hypothetical protein